MLSQIIYILMSPINIMLILVYYDDGELGVVLMMIIMLMRRRRRMKVMMMMIQMMMLMMSLRRGGVGLNNDNRGFSWPPKEEQRPIFQRKQDFLAFLTFFFVWRRDSKFIKGIKPLEYIYGIMSYTVFLYLHFYICAFETMEHHYSYP